MLYLCIIVFVFLHSYTSDRITGHTMIALGFPSKIFIIIYLFNVQVYTVNNESKYILIHNIPSVGAKEELIKLCSSFGDLEESHILDEYPSSEKYTEVYLIKFKRINSARLAN